MTKRKLTVRDHMIHLLRESRRSTLTAIQDLQRADRIDALDSIAMAHKQLDQAANVIRETLPSGVS